MHYDNDDDGMLWKWWWSADMKCIIKLNDETMLTFIIRISSTAAISPMIGVKAASEAYN